MHHSIELDLRRDGRRKQRQGSQEETNQKVQRINKENWQQKMKSILKAGDVGIVGVVS